MKKTKILALILSCVMLVCLAGCGNSSYGTINGKNIDAYLFDAAVSNSIRGYLSNGQDPTSLRDMLAQEDESGVTGAEAVKEYCLESIKQFYAIEAMAKEHNIELTSAELKSIEDSKAAYIEEQGSRAKFVASLKESGMNEEAFDFLQNISALQQKLANAVFNRGGVHEVPEDKIVSDMTENCIRVVHILIQAQPNQVDFAERKAKAEATLARVNAGEDFTALINEVNEDPGMTSQPDGYVLDKQGYAVDTGSQMVPEFTEASWKLAVNQTSDLVQSDYGFHIIKRLPLDEAFVRENIDTYYASYASLAFGMELSKVVAELDVKTNDKYANLDVASFIPATSN